MQNILKELRESPIFNMSLSSKELFHSNFLAWFFEQYPAACFTMLNIDEPSNFDPSKFRIKREEDHIDLKIVYGDNVNESLLAVIENKVKSLPSYSQLKNYGENNKLSKSKHFILLTLVPAEKIPTEWVEITYQDILVKFNKLLEANSEIALKSDYHRELISDYLKFITNLVKLTNKWTYNSKQELLDSPYNAFMNTEEFKRVRLNDIASKLKGLHITDLLNDNAKLINKLSDGMWLVDEEERKKLNFGDYRILNFYSNQTAIVDYKVLIKIDDNNTFIQDGKTYFNTIHFGVQIQGKQFRFVVETRNNQFKALDICQEFGQEFWLKYLVNCDFSKITDDLELRGNNRKKNINEKFAKFDEQFRYKYYEIKDSAKVADILKIIDDIHKDLISLENNVDFHDCIERGIKKW